MTSSPEHARLLRLATRASVDRMQTGGALTFFTVLSFGMSCKLAWERWGWLPVAPVLQLAGSAM